MIYVRDERLWKRAGQLAGDDGLSKVILDLLAEWIRKKEADVAGQMVEVQLTVGGEAYAAEHADIADRIAFKGRLLAEQ